MVNCIQYLSCKMIQDIKHFVTSINIYLFFVVAFVMGIFCMLKAFIRWIRVARSHPLESFGLGNWKARLATPHPTPHPHQYCHVLLAVGSGNSAAAKRERKISLGVPAAHRDTNVSLQYSKNTPSFLYCIWRTRKSVAKPSRNSAHTAFCKAKMSPLLRVAGNTAGP